ncbi:MAG: hypothetical protein PVG72_12030 [Gammaproteobacteria bacterium]
MSIKRTHSRLAVIATLISVNAVSAGNEQPWHYDEDNDTIVYSFVGHPGASQAPNASQQQVENLSWHYDEDSDTVAYSFVGYPGASQEPNASQQTAVNLPWHYDKETDTVVYDFAERTVEQATVVAGMTE